MILLSFCLAVRVHVASIKSQLSLILFVVSTISRHSPSLPPLILLVLHNVHSLAFAGFLKLYILSLPFYRIGVSSSAMALHHRDEASPSLQ